MAVRRSRCVLVSTLLLTASTAHAVPLLEHGEEARLSSFRPSAQESVAVATSPQGSVVAWESRRQEHGTYGVYLQRLAPDGSAIGGETRANVTVAGMQLRPAVAMDGEGAIWIAWESHGQDGSLSGIVARRLGADGTDRTGEILVNETVAGPQADVAIAATGDGGALVAWTTPAADRCGSTIVLRSFDATGRARTSELPVATSPGGQRLPALAATKGGAIVVWAATAVDGTPSAIRARLVDPKGRVRGGEIEIATGGSPIEPSVDAAPDGSFAVAWLEPHGDDHAVHSRSFDAAGFALGPARRLSGEDDRLVSGVATALSPLGIAAVAWNRRDGQGSSDVVVQLLDRGGEPLGIPGLATCATRGEQRLAVARGSRRIAWDGEERLLVGWSGDAGVASGGDKRSANLTVATSSLAPLRLRSVPSTGWDDPVQEVASPHRPPTYDPRSITWLPHGGDPDPSPRAGGFGFIGVTNTGWTPPDPHMAVGPGHIVEMTNGAIAFFDKAGNNTFQQPIEGGSGFWGSLGAEGFVFDPEVLFDPHSGRFIAMACEGYGTGSRSYFLLAASDDSDPNGSWNKYRLDVTTLGGNDIDSPNVAVDAQAIYLTADFFAPDAYLVYILDKASVLAGNPPTTRSLLVTGSQSYGIPVTYDAAAPALYMAEGREYGTYTDIVLHAITDPLGSPQRVTTSLTVPQYEHPVDPPQQGTSIRPELFEARFWNTVYRNGSLWAVHHQGASRALVRWYQIAMNGWPASGTPQLLQSGDIDPGAGVHTFFPSIWVDAVGNAAITCARSSTSEFISMARALRLSTDPPGTFGPLVTERTSSGPYTQDRWGDYSQTNDDPAAAGTFWGVHEYAPTSGSWNTYIARYDFGSCPAITLSPSTLPAGSVGTGYSQTITASGGTAPYTFAVTSGALPPGLTLSTAGLLSGTPTTAGSSTFTVTATDATSCTGSQPYTLDITTSCGVIDVQPPALPGGTVGIPYSAALSASGGTSPYAFALIAGALPPGLTLSPAGLLSGTPAAAGSTSFTVRATDALGCSGSRAYVLTIADAADYVVGQGLGQSSPNGVAYHASDGSPTGVSFVAYGAGQWGTNVASGDLDGGSAEALTGPGPGAVYGPHVRGWTRLGTAVAKVSYFAYGTLRYGVNVGAARLDADAFHEILTGAGPGEVFGPHVRGWNADGGVPQALPGCSFFAYSTLRYGVNVEDGDVDADGFHEIVTGAGPGSVFAAHVRGFDVDGGAASPIPGLNFIAFAGLVHGVNVAGGDVDADGFAEVAATPGPGPTSSYTSMFRGFDVGGPIAMLPGFDITLFAATHHGGRVGLGDVLASGSEALLAGAGRDPAADATVLTYAYDGTGLTQAVPPFLPFPSLYGINVASGGLGYVP